MIVELDEYEIANLAAALRAIAGHKDDGTWDWGETDWRSPLMALNTGDWVCQILNKLPAVTYPHTDKPYMPNKSPEQARADARAMTEKPHSLRGEA